MDTRSNGAGGAPLGTINRSVLMYSAPEVDELFAQLQPTLTFDDVPTDGSQNPVRSNGIYQEIYGLVQAIGQAMDDIVADIGGDTPFTPGLFAQDESTGLWHKVVIEDDGEGRKVLAAEQTGIER